VSKAIDKAAGAVREVVGFDPVAAKRAAAVGGSAFGDYKGQTGDVTAPATDDARQWQGWGTALKPALEPITVARKPLVGTVAANVLQHGTGALNIDGSRVPAEKATGWGGGGSALYEGGLSRDGGEARLQDSGRWPANLIHDGSAEVSELLRHATRFFYCAKASRKDRDDGLDAFEIHSAGELTGGRAEGSAGLNCPSTGAGRTGGVGGRNTHPTVKPTDLMRYLCRLVTPPGGVVLDPFTGAGSTGKAALLEGFQFIGIEREQEYIEIASARINSVANDNFLMPNQRMT
jgi:site-specific DNA-methyltransferase (adenine-specific)